MMYAQYCRIESKAGGYYCTNKDFIKAAHGLLSKKGKSNKGRTYRHAWLRAGLVYKIDARANI